MSLFLSLGRRWWCGAFARGTGTVSLARARAARSRARSAERPHVASVGGSPAPQVILDSVGGSKG
jgi:hypothetical protein